MTRGSLTDVGAADTGEGNTSSSWGCWHLVQQVVNVRLQADAAALTLHKKPGPRDENIEHAIA